MNITCVICSELFITGADIYFAHCGHVFHYHCLINWLERSKSCPQCRNRVTEKTIHKAYFNIPSAEPSVDATTLMYKLENVNWTLTLKEKEIKTLTEKKRTLKEQNQALREEIAKNENSGRKLQSKLLSYKDEINILKARVNETTRLAEEIAKLKNDIRKMEHVEAVIYGTMEQVQGIIREHNKLDELALLVATLKQALLKSEKRARDKDFSCKTLKNDVSTLKKEYALLEVKNADLRRELQQIKFKYQKEKLVLRQRLKESTKNNIVLTNPEAGLPRVDTNRTESNLINLDTSHNKSTNEPNLLLNSTLTVAERVDAISKSDSPYLPVKSNFASFLDTKFQAPSTAPVISVNKEFSMFAPSQKLADVKNGHATDEICYNGLGGSQKEDIFPSPKTNQLPKKRNKSSSISSSKFRKLAPTARTKPKIVDFLTLSD